jgi:HPt (histidine-containing phosphotransfer) domain-containing protein
LPADETEALRRIDRTIFDWARITEPFGGWNGEARQFMEDFLAELPDKVTPLTDAIEAGDKEKARFAAHRLKGAAWSAGAERLGQTAASIQKCIDADDLAMARTLGALLAMCSAELETALSPILAKRGA